MMKPIEGTYGPIIPPSPSNESKTKATASTGDFAADLKAAIEGVTENIASADNTSSDALIRGGGPHEAMIALSKAELSFRMMTQVRNKVVDAYREIMRMTM